MSIRGMSHHCDIAINSAADVYFRAWRSCSVALDVKLSDSFSCHRYHRSSVIVMDTVLAAGCSVSCHFVFVTVFLMLPCVRSPLPTQSGRLHSLRYKYTAVAYMSNVGLLRVPVGWCHFLQYYYFSFRPLSLSDNDPYPILRACLLSIGCHAMILRS